MINDVRQNQTGLRNHIKTYQKEEKTEHYVNVHSENEPRRPSRIIKQDIIRYF